MSAFIVRFRTAWDYYFQPASLNYLNSQTYTSRQTNSNNGVYVSNCLFRSIKSTSTGGALYFSNSASYFLVESSSFFSCNTSNGYGGAIYFYNAGSGQSVLHKVCGFDCCSSYSSPYYQFAYIEVNGAVTSKNYVNYSSITRCINANANSHYTLYLCSGKICCPSVNISLNECQYYSGIYCSPYGDYNYVTCSFSYSTFADNVANGCICIMLTNSGAKFEIKSCNILRNTQGSLNSEGTICANGNLMIYDSCILENNATYIFRQGSSYIITVLNCTVDSTSFYGNFNTQNTVTKSFILALKHMSTQNCHAEYDSVGSLTPNLQPFLKMG
jgi:hypothetical protein